MTHPPCTAPETCRPHRAGTASALTNGATMDGSSDVTSSDLALPRLGGSPTTARVSMSARHEHASSSDSGVSISCTIASAGMASGSAMAARGREVANQSAPGA